MTSVEELLSSPVAGHEGQCQICYSSINPKAKAPCGHDDICGICHLRLRYLHSSNACPMCKTPNEQLVVDTTPKLFEEYPLWGNELGEDYTYNTHVGMFFPTEYYLEQVEPLFGHQCHDCDEYDGTTPDENIYETRKRHKKPPTPLRALQDHLRTKHRLALCQLCVDFKRDFISQLPRFTPSQLKQHLCKGDGSDSGFKGHPLCEFCRPKRFYDLEKLHHHLQTDHYKCHVCDKQGKPNQYFKNYSSLEHHFDAMHFLCKDVQCLQARFVVFDNEIDLRGHELNVHGGTSTGSTKIQLEFRYRRPGESSRYENQEVPSESDFQYALDGQAFVPESIEEDSNQQAGAPNEATSHPLHWQRTNELRAHAAQVRQQQHSEVEAFPSLGGESSTPLNVGWSSSDTSRLLRPRTKEEDFPSLQPPSSSTSMSAASAKLKANSGNSRQFAAMRSAASVAAAPPASSSAAAYPPAAASTNWTLSTSSIPATRNRESDLTMDNFPALGGGGTRRYVAAEQLAKKKPPSLSSSSEFPPPPKSSTVRQHVLKQESKKPPPAMDNVLDFPPPPSQKDAAVVIEELKTTLGTTRYKQLKRLTKEFASNTTLSPQQYVDQARNLFDSNVDVYKYLPSLLESCPNEASAKQARRYVEELRTNNNSTLSKPNNVATTSSWATVGATSSNVNRAAVASRSTAAPKKSSTGSSAAWSSGGSSSAARAKPVAVEAPSSKPSTKKSGGSKKKKSKQNDELRALAFGGK